MDFIHVCQLIVILSVTAGALAISLPTALLWLPASLVILGWILVALLGRISRIDSCKGLNGTGSGSGKMER